MESLTVTFVIMIVFRFFNCFVLFVVSVCVYECGVSVYVSQKNEFVAMLLCVPFDGASFVHYPSTLFESCFFNLWIENCHFFLSLVKRKARAKPAQFLMLLGCKFKPPPPFKGMKLTIIKLRVIKNGRI